MNTDISLNELKSILSEDNFTILGHGTGYDNIDAVKKIFENGLRASHTSIFYTTIGLDVQNDVSEFQNKLDNWPHKDSENIILIKLPNDFFNIYGDSIDLGCEKTWAFVNKRIDDYGNSNYYLDPKFIVGSYNRNSKVVTINPNFEAKLSSSTLKDLERKLLEGIERTRKKNESFAKQLLEPFPIDDENENNFNLDYSTEISSFDDNIDWDTNDNIKK